MINLVQNAEKFVKIDEAHPVLTIDITVIESNNKYLI